MEWLADPSIWMGLATLVVLEIVLGIDNLVFIAILADKLPPHQRDRARVIGLALALLMRLVLLAALAWIMKLTEPLVTLFDHSFSGRDLILLGGGLFLLFKGTMELHERLEGREHHEDGGWNFAALRFHGVTCLSSRNLVDPFFLPSGSERATIHIPVPDRILKQYNERARGHNQFVTRKPPRQGREKSWKQTIGPRGPRSASARNLCGSRLFGRDLNPVFSNRHSSPSRDSATWPHELRSPLQKGVPVYSSIRICLDKNMRVEAYSETP